MVVREIQGVSSFNAALAVPNLVVVDFFATWCGPCVQIGPFVEQLSGKYPDVVFLKVNADENRDITGRAGITAYPTFQFFINGAKVDEMRGANPQKLEEKVTTLKAMVSTSFGGQGHALGGGSSETVWDGIGCPPGMENARAARLKAFGHLDAKKTNSTVSSCQDSSSNVEDDEDEAIARAIALSMAPEGTSGKGIITENASETLELPGKDKPTGNLTNIESGEDWDGEEMVPVPVDESLLAQLVSMDFPEVRARKGLVHGKTLEGALSWIEDNQENPDIDQPYMVKKKDAIPKKPLTEEEKAAKIQELKEKAARIKRERIEKEKADELQREKERRQRGQKMEETDEERARLARKRDAARKKKEKEDAIKERQRLRAEIARDKELRRANKGVIPSVLGIDGYNPSAVQYDKKEECKEPTTTSTNNSEKSSSSGQSTSAVPKMSSSVTNVPCADPVTVIDSSIATIAKYRTGGDGGAALKLLHLLLRNILNNPDDSKYRSINMEGKAYKGKLAHLVGPAALLKAVGFVLNETGDKLVLSDGEGSLISDTVDKIAKAEAVYNQLNR